MIPRFEHYTSATLTVPTFSALLGTTVFALAVPIQDAVLTPSLQLPDQRRSSESLFYLPADYRPPQEVLQSFADRMHRDSIELSPAAAEIIDEHFWELLL